MTQLLLWFFIFLGVFSRFWFFLFLVRFLRLLKENIMILKKFGPQKVVSFWERRGTPFFSIWHFSAGFFGLSFVYSVTDYGNPWPRSFHFASGGRCSTFMSGRFSMFSQALSSLLIVEYGNDVTHSENWKIDKIKIFVKTEMLHCQTFSPNSLRKVSLPRFTPLQSLVSEFVPIKIIVLAT